MLITSSSFASTQASVGHTWEVKQRRMNTKWVYLAEGEGSMQMTMVEADEDGIMMRETVRKPDAVAMCGLKSTDLLRKAEITKNKNCAGTHTHTLSSQQCNKRKINSAGWGKMKWCLEYRKY